MYLSSNDVFALRATCKSILERKTSLRCFGGWGGLAYDVLKFVYLHPFVHNQGSFSIRIESNTNKA